MYPVTVPQAPGEAHVDVVSEYQNVGTARARVTRGHHDLTGQLLFDVDVELLNSALLEIRILRQNGPREIGRVRRRIEGEPEIPADILAPALERFSTSKADSATAPARPYSRTNRDKMA